MLNMKIAYISKSCYADTDFPLIRKYQQMGHEVHYFLNVDCRELHSTLIDINVQNPNSCLLSPEAYPELDVYRNYIDMSNVYIVNRAEKSSINYKTLRLAHLVDKKLQEIQPDVIHLLEPPYINNLLLYKWRKKMVLTMHDPFPHTGESFARRSFFRNIAFKLIKKFVLLNARQKSQFSSRYKIQENNILINSIGRFDYLQLFVVPRKKKSKVNVLFFGRISPYKGVEYLCEAMTKVHEVLPGVTLTIAGGGDFYFDIAKYSSKNWIKIVNKYIGVKQMAELFDDCTISVCPYTDATQSGVINTSYSFSKPVVATNVGGLPEMVEQGKSGLLVQPKNSDKLADTIISILENENNLLKMQKFISDEYYASDKSWDIIANKYIEFYKML